MKEWLFLQASGGNGISTRKDNLTGNVDYFVNDKKYDSYLQMNKLVSKFPKIKEIIGAILPSMVTMFMSIDSLYEKLFNSIKGYLLVEENKIIVCNYIISMLNNLKDTKIEEIIRSLSEDDFNNICKNISDLLNNKLLSDENILMCIEKFEKYMENTLKLH